MKRLFTTLAFLLLSTSVRAENSALPMLEEDLIKAITSAITLTEFTAVIDIKKVKRLPETEEYGWVGQKVQADVIEVISGKGPAENMSIEYVEYVEVDDVYLIQPDKPVMISLCKDGGSWFWAGVGTYFDASPDVVARAKVIAERHNYTPISREFCE
ncbi:hypothetical protein [Vibrio parahaemolyticus]|uniref:hypothetical protein n=2 Tax=Vibrio parahaemolyticus TaxID=670 RepID=UPI001EEC7A95|nr:hypothetical protein [Vibrio parahaemolyticus]MCG6442335.1 hypothetical protein [Vibrio parahaemolyticus]MCG6455642.1 hypothetical protein [Vibrio parahaemolyticus]HCG7314996.1 hypothetical protein [Vibrio parahaemolyticus]HCG7383616.1 hypothetical protein [Vibrio parahaemolyticus]HCH1968035.1 hypothetical protein [Vibrio parahaemolyticus]